MSRNVCSRHGVSPLSPESTMLLSIATCLGQKPCLVQRLNRGYAILQGATMFSELIRSDDTPTKDKIHQKLLDRCFFVLPDTRTSKCERENQHSRKANLPCWNHHATPDNVDKGAQNSWEYHTSASPLDAAQSLHFEETRFVLSRSPCR